MIYIRSSFIKQYSCDDFAFQVIEMLKDENIPYRIANQSFVEDMNFRRLKEHPFEDRMKSEFQFVINPACFLEHYGLDKNTIVYTMWDSDILPPKYVIEVQKARLCIVPSNATKEVFIRSGVTIPIEVIPHGFDPIIFYPKDKNPYAEHFVIGCSGQVTSEKNDKKDIESIVYAFRMAFMNVKNVILEIKITPDSKVPSFFSDNRIILNQEFLSPMELADWYRNLDCYVNASKYEAFGRQPMEVIACGTPIITPMHSGIVDYYSDDMGFTIGHTMVNANTPPYVEGHWYNSNVDEMVSQLRYIYKNRVIANNIASIASKKIMSFSDNNWKSKLIRLIRRYAY